jgi:hypothetical protein
LLCKMKRLRKLSKLYPSVSTTVRIIHQISAWHPDKEVKLIARHLLLNINTNDKEKLITYWPEYHSTFSKLYQASLVGSGYGGLYGLIRWATMSRTLPGIYRL